MSVLQQVGTTQWGGGVALLGRGCWGCPFHLPGPREGPPLAMQFRPAQERCAVREMFWHAAFYRGV